MQAPAIVAAAGAGARQPLPVELLPTVLRHMDQRSRLAAASVSRAWATAAAAASSVVVIDLDGQLDVTETQEDAWQARVDGMAAWLVDNGPHVRALRVLGPMSPNLNLALPLARLPQLGALVVSHGELHEARPGLQPAGSPRSLGGLGTLTALQLAHVEVYWSSGLASLTALTGLRSLELAFVTVHRGGGAAEQRAALGGSLAQLSAELTRLVLERVAAFGWSYGEELVSDAVLVPALGKLTALQHLRLQAEAVTADSFAVLPASLTALAVRGAQRARFGASSGIWQLPALRQLELEQPGGLEARQLSSLSRLSSLRVAGAPCGARDGLLAALPQLLELRQLALDDGALGGPRGAPEACRALLPDTLTALRLDAGELPAGAGRHLFAPGAPRPRLLELVLDSGLAPHADEPACLGDGDVALLVACCSNLQRLELGPGAAAPQPLTVLRQLAGSLTSLALGGPAVDDEAAKHALAHLSALRSLRVVRAAPLSDAGVAALTCLRQLEGLNVSACSSVTLEPEQPGELHIRSNDQQGPVWLQLYQLCVAQASSRRAASSKAGKPAVAAGGQQPLRRSSSGHSRSRAPPPAQPADDSGGSHSGGSFSGGSGHRTRTFKGHTPKCGTCRTCTNPKLKQACVVNRERVAAGLEALLPK